MNIYQNKRLAIIGASYLQLPLVKKAKKLGLETHVFAWEEGAVAREIADHFYPISILEKEIILDTCRKIQPHGVLSIASDLAVPTVNFIAKELGLTGNSFSCTNYTTKKQLMRAQLYQAGLPCPAFLSLDDPAKLLFAGTEKLNYPLIVKPTDRSGSRGVTKAKTIDDLEQAVMDAFNASFEKHVIVEEFISGQEFSVETISWQGKHHFLAITDKTTTGEPYFVETEQHQPAEIDEAQKNEIIDLVFRSLDALELEYGAAHSEIIVTADKQIYIVEIGSRMGGDFIGSDLVYLSTGYDYLKGIIDISLGHFTEPVKTREKCSGVYFLGKETEYLYHYFDGNDDKRIVDKQLTELPLKHLRNSGDRNGYLLYASHSKVIFH